MMKMITIKITHTEYYWVAFAGMLRQWQSALRENPRAEFYGHDASKGYDDHILGCLGEYAASLAIGLPWRGPGVFRGDDIAGFQVRTTRHSGGDLILHKKDKDNARFILVTGTDFQWDVCGWITARDGKQKQFWEDKVQNGRPAFFVPQWALKPIGELIGGEWRQKYLGLTRKHRDFKRELALTFEEIKKKVRGRRTKSEAK